MHQPGTPWPAATRVSFIVAFEELRRHYHYPRLRARRFCEVSEERWDGIGPGPPEEWERGLQDCVRFYNRRRQHSPPGLHATHGVSFGAPTPTPDLSRVLKHCTRVQRRLQSTRR